MENQQLAKLADAAMIPFPFSSDTAIRIVIMFSAYWQAALVL